MGYLYIFCHKRYRKIESYIAASSVAYLAPIYGREGGREGRIVVYTCMWYWKNNFLPFKLYIFNVNFMVMRGGRMFPWPAPFKHALVHHRYRVVIRPIWGDLRVNSPFRLRNSTLPRFRGHETQKWKRRRRARRTWTDKELCAFVSFEPSENDRGRRAWSRAAAVVGTKKKRTISGAIRVVIRGGGWSPLIFTYHQSQVAEE